MRPWVRNPQLYQLINSNQEEFLALLNEPAPADALANLAAGMGGMEGMEGMDMEGMEVGPWGGAPRRRTRMCTTQSSLTARLLAFTKQGVCRYGHLTKRFDCG